jgi:RNA polymerase sigma factor (sigma-70 family)
MQSANQELTQVPEPLSLEEFERLVRMHRPRLYNFIRRRMGNLEDVEDLLQESLVEALKSRVKFSHQSRPETWLFGIAMNLMRNHYKRFRARDVFDEADTDEVAAEVGRGPAEIAETHQLMLRVSEVFDGLPEDTRTVVHLVFDEQLTYEETAARLGIPVGTVRSRVWRARAQLKDMQLF